MAKELTPGVGDEVTLAATVTQLTLPASYPANRKIRTVVIYESDVDLYVVTHNATDGAALPATGRVPFAAAALPVEYDIGEAAFVGLAGTGAGACWVEVR